MKASRALLGGIAVGSGLMYTLDKRRGAQRRAIVLGKAHRYARKLARTINVGKRDLANRARGVLYRVSVIGSGDETTDGVLDARVHAALGHACSHAHAIAIHVDHGCVELRGPVLQSEIDHVLRAVSRVRGVHDVKNALEVHASPDVPALQGQPFRARPNVLRRLATPAARLVVGAGVVSVGAYSLIARAT
jgi:hypothetical protein